MPEGPSILLMKEDLQKFAGKKVILAVGNAKFDRDLLVGKTLKEIRLYGKQTYLIFDEINVRIHLLMFGSYEIDGQMKPDSNLRLGLSFKNGKAFFYTCSVKLLPNDFLKSIDWEADVMSDIWNPEKAEAKLRSNPEMMVCDALMNQDIFSGVGNIIKNEVLFRIAVQPESLVGDLPPEKLNELISEARNYSFDFLKWKRENTLKRHWKAHHQKNCPQCGKPLISKITGKSKRRSFYCEADQKLY
ncbi:DNA-formamidopyrimidine glycosylase family protein [Epilithonimonas caeni]|uniref:DNA-formamidopyrimidine glycosylase family protein n=1 Tax=Epilithonimonas caeni TaxID=365343 RepID=UPI000416B764|nr:DNA-formamidopyrimidine glycosylase family protein [Epilithonimonas caeni]